MVDQKSLWKGKDSKLRASLTKDTVQLNKYLVTSIVCRLSFLQCTRSSTEVKKERSSGRRRSRGREKEKLRQQCQQPTVNLLTSLGYDSFEMFSL
ncbi:hypothetical protein V1477_013710 [Vespula maculifrons]|uniref:Uncharacterized protein n=1 Tax=Vespula maculifrons TaxID=7453 RepID=A0ABD2BP26_VESMC